MNDEAQRKAMERIGQTATLTKGLLRGTVKILSSKWAYGRTMFLVSNDRGESEWVNETKLEFTPQQSKQ